MDPMAAFVEELQKAVYANTEKIKFDNSPRAKTIMALFATIYEQIESANILLRKAQFAGVELIQRANLEAIVHLINLINAPEYLGVMQANHHSQFLSMLDEGLKGTNVYLSTIAGNVNAQKARDESKAILDSLKANEIHAMNAFQRFERAGFADIYRSAYINMSGSAHQDLGTLVRRHFEEVDGDVQVHLHMQFNKIDVENMLDSIAGVLNTSNLIVHKHFNSPALPLFEELDKKLAQLRYDRDNPLPATSLSH
jgi:hypothetical protein